MEIYTIGSSSTGNCHKIDDKQTALLIECGLPFKKILSGLNYDTSDIHGCLISHAHGDHCEAINEVIAESIPCFASMGEISLMRAKNLFKKDYSDSRLVKIVAGKQFKIGTFTIKPFNVSHSTPEPLGFYIKSNHTNERLVYLCDTSYSRYVFPGLDYIMVECNYDETMVENNEQLNKKAKEHILTGHFGLQNVKDFLGANDLSKVKCIHLLHLSSRHSDAEKFKKEIQEEFGKPVIIAPK